MSRRTEHALLSLWRVTPYGAARWRQAQASWGRFWCAGFAPSGYDARRRYGQDFHITNIFCNKIAVSSFASLPRTARTFAHPSAGQRVRLSPRGSAFPWQWAPADRSSSWAAWPLPTPPPPRWRSRLKYLRRWALPRLSSRRRIAKRTCFTIMLGLTVFVCLPVSLPKKSNASRCQLCVSRRRVTDEFFLCFSFSLSLSFSLPLSPVALPWVGRVQ